MFCWGGMGRGGTLALQERNNAVLAHADPQYKLYSVLIDGSLWGSFMVLGEGGWGGGVTVLLFYSLERLVLP